MSDSNFHAVWCGHRSTNESHDDNYPYCLKQVHGVDLMPAPGEQKASLWVYVTGEAHPSAMTSGKCPPDAKQYDGIELTTECRVGDEWVDRTLRLSADAARSLAAALIRSADIKQGLDQ